MAKPLVFKIDGQEIAFDMNKVDRTKLYGYKDLEIIDEHGEKCEMATLAEDGHTIIGRGGTGIGYLTADGLWCDKSQLQAVDLSGQPIAPVPSSFLTPIELAEPTRRAMSTLLIRFAVSMRCRVNRPLVLIDKLKSGAIYKFAYSYRGGLEADTAFLLCNDAGDVFMAVGSPTVIDFIGLEQAAAVVEDESTEDEADSDDMDFSMI